MKTLPERVSELVTQHPENIALQSFEASDYLLLSDEARTRFERCLQSGLNVPHSTMGCYATEASDYKLFRSFFTKALSAHHQVPLGARHQSDWGLESNPQTLETDGYNLAVFGLRDVSMRVRVARNLVNTPLTASLSQVQRIELENRLHPVFGNLINHVDYRGRYYSLTPGHVDQMDDGTCESLIAQGLMFRNLQDDPYMSAAGIASHWPYGRGCYVSDDGAVNIWVGEEDHLRIMCRTTGTRLSEPFRKLASVIDLLGAVDDDGSNGVGFACSDDFGYITSCPTNLGTGMRASVHVALPGLTRDGSDQALKALARSKGLAVRGVAGEHTPMGEGGLVDISPAARYCITEVQIISSLFNGVGELLDAEQKASW